VRIWPDGHSAKLLDLPEPDLAGWRHAIEVATSSGERHAGEGAMRLVYDAAGTWFGQPLRHGECGRRADRRTRRDGLPR